ncbi:MAG: hypothetical protein ACTH31_09025, partial [Pseudoclavibacter sp.]
MTSPMHGRTDATTAAARRRGDPRIRRYLSVALAAFAAWCALLVSLVSFPPVDEPAAVDVVFVLGPAWPERVATGVRLVEAGYASTLVISVGEEGP